MISSDTDFIAGQPQEISPTLMQPHHPLKEPSLDNARHMQL